MNEKILKTGIVDKKNYQYRVVNDGYIKDIKVQDPSSDENSFEGVKYLVKSDCHVIDQSGLNGKTISEYALSIIDFMNRHPEEKDDDLIKSLENYIIKQEN